MHPIDDATDVDDALPGELPGEPGGFDHRLVARGGDEEEHGRGRPKQGHHFVGALAEPGLHAGERLKEGDCIGEDFRADDTADRPQHGLRRHVEHAHARPSRQHQQLEQAVVEESGEHARGGEKVERAAGRRRVDHHKVEPVVAGEEVQRLGRHVLLGAAERSGHVAEERVGDDALGLRRVDGVSSDHGGERRGGIEHHRPQLTARLGGAGELDTARFGTEVADAESIGETLRRIDREDDDAPAATRGFDAERRGHRGLADASRPAADDDGRLVEHRLQGVG